MASASPAGVETQYARSGDAYLAYQVLGDGPIDLLSAGTATMVSIDSIADEPHWDRFDRRLASFARLIRFDRRGVGLSDGDTPSSPPTIEQGVADALAVMDAAGADRAAIFGPNAGGLTAMMLCATVPERTTGLVLCSAFARAARADDYPWGAPVEMVEWFRNSLVDPEGVGEPADDVGLMAPSLAGDPAFRSWWRRAGQRGASPTTARAQLVTTMETDVRPILASIRTPTLVLHRAEDAIVPVGHGRYLAEHIPGAKYVELPGADYLPFSGDSDAIVDEIEEFLTGVRHEPDAERVLTTVLFSDIVDSTANAAALGDRAWRARLDDHDAMVRRRIDQFGGVEVNTTGDGFVATFDGPARAVRCGLAVCGDAEGIGLSIRAGVHTGEVERRGADIGGIGVHIAARVTALAGPDQVLVSSTVKDLVAGSGIRFADHGTHQLKGVPDPWRLFRADDG
jgi:pimeloyl-ACP methyl ester carboxylesterase/class 3 adenylate cyclase